jgi:hypothetical protein
MIGEPRGHCGQLRKVSPLPEFELQAAQSVASCYINNDINEMIIAGQFQVISYPAEVCFKYQAV